jgi:hypothetical protein
VFPIVLAVQKLSGVGADSIFMGVVRNRVDEDPNMVKVRGAVVHGRQPASLVRDFKSCYGQE